MGSISSKRSNQIYNIELNRTILKKVLSGIKALSIISLVLMQSTALVAQVDNNEQTILHVIDSLRNLEYNSFEAIRYAQKKLHESFDARDDLPQIWAFYRLLLKKSLVLGRSDLYNSLIIDVVGKYNSLGQGTYAQELLLDTVTINNNLTTCYERIRIYLALSQTYQLIYYPSSLELKKGVKWARRALEESRACDNYYQINALFSLVSLYSKVNIDSADYFMNEILSLSKGPSVEQLLGRLERKKGNRQGELTHLRRAFRMAHKYPELMKRLLTNWEHPLGVAYRNNGILDSALNIFHRVLDTTSAEKLTRIIIPSINLGILYSRNERPDSAIYYLTRAFEGAKKIGAVYHVYEALEWLIKTFEDNEQFKEASIYLKAELEFERARRNKEIINIHAIESFKSELKDYRQVLSSEELRNSSSRYSILLFTSLGLVTILTISYLLMRRSMLRKNKLRTEIELSRLALMNAQFNPHFLFNSLLAITAKAKEVIGSNGPRDLGLFSLSKLLRASLKSVNSVVIALETEIDLIRGLIELENIRKEDDFKFEIEGVVKNTLVISGFIQPFVENALQHAYPKEASVKRILVNVDVNHQSNVIQIIDNGYGFKMESIDGKSSFGIANVLKRAALMNKIVDKCIEIDIRNEIDKGTVVTVSFTNSKENLDKLVEYFDS